MNATASAGAELAMTGECAAYGSGWSRSRCRSIERRARPRDRPPVVGAAFLLLAAPLCGLAADNGSAPGGGVLPSVPRHVMFAFVDHFEPLPYTQAAWQVEMWVDDYMAMASGHADADGRHPVHSYFLYFDSPSPDAYVTTCLTMLNEVTYHGYGEVNFHLHHGVADERTRTEEEATTDLISLLTRAMDLFQQRGCLVTAEGVPQQAFAFIHGMWALDNSRLDNWDDPSDPHRQYCGVNSELGLLRSWGCYAEYTFPAWGPMNPVLVNSIFYAQDDSLPASYKNPVNDVLVTVGQPPCGDLLLVEGPAVNPNISEVDLPTLTRMDAWVACNVHVVGQNDWIFVKVHAHGASGRLHNPQVWDAFFGAPMDQFYSAIEAKYNDGVNWKLHYVSAREMYNIIKAAEAGLTGDPNAYRNYVVQPYPNTVILTDQPYQVLSYTPQMALLHILVTSGMLDVSMKEFDVCASLEESSDQSTWTAFDGTVNPGAFDELHFTDLTPSSYYRVTCVASPWQDDFDEDGDVDLIDFASLSDCLAGPGGQWPAPECQVFDADCDRDVDVRDFAGFQRLFGAGTGGGDL